MLRWLLLPTVILALVGAGCSTTFNGYRKGPQIPHEIIHGDAIDESFPPLELSEEIEVPTLIPDPNRTAVPFFPTEYRSVWIAPHKNQFGDAVHGHHCEILFKEASFEAQKVPSLPPSAPVLVTKDDKGAKPFAALSAQPESIQDYLKQIGVIPNGS